jgi:tetratricopeptide (TPR) repeat protein
MAEVDLNQKLKSFLESAFKKISSEDYLKAIDDLKEAEKLDSNNPEVLYNLGVSYCRMHKYDSAISYFEKLLKLPYTFVDLITVNILYAYALILTGDIRGAIKYIDDVLNLSPNNTVLLNMLGYCFEQQKKYREAIKVFRKIIEIDRHNYNAYNSLAYVISLTEGNLNEALKFAKIALESNTENPAYLDTIGYVYLKKGNLDISKNYLKKALSKLPDSEEVKGHINELLKIDGQ